MTSTATAPLPGCSPTPTKAPSNSLNYIPSPASRGREMWAPFANFANRCFAAAGRAISAVANAGVTLGYATTAVALHPIDYSKKGAQAVGNAIGERTAKVRAHLSSAKDSFSQMVGQHSDKVFEKLAQRLSEKRAEEGKVIQDLSTKQTLQGHAIYVFQRVAEVQKALITEAARDRVLTPKEEFLINKTVIELSKSVANDIKLINWKIDNAAQCKKHRCQMQTSVQQFKRLMKRLTK